MRCQRVLVGIVTALGALCILRLLPSSSSLPSHAPSFPFVVNENCSIDRRQLARSVDATLRGAVVTPLTVAPAFFAKAVSALIASFDGHLRHLLLDQRLDQFFFIDEPLSQASIC